MRLKQRLKCTMLYAEVRAQTECDEYVKEDVPSWMAP